MEVFNQKQGFNGHRINDICTDNSGRFWLATADGLKTFDGNKFTDINSEANAFHIGYPILHGVIQLNNIIFCVSKDSLYSLNLNTQKLLTFKINNNFQDHINKLGIAKIDENSFLLLAGDSLLNISCNSSSKIKIIEIKCPTISNSQIKFSQGKFLVFEKLNIKDKNFSDGYCYENGKMVKCNVSDFFVNEPQGGSKDFWETSLEKLPKNQSTKNVAKLVENAHLKSVSEKPEIFENFIRTYFNGNALGADLGFLISQVAPYCLYKDKEGGLWFGNHTGLAHIYRANQYVNSIGTGTGFYKLVSFKSKDLYSIDWRSNVIKFDSNYVATPIRIKASNLFKLSEKELLIIKPNGINNISIYNIQSKKLTLLTDKFDVNDNITCMTFLDDNTLFLGGKNLYLLDIRLKKLNKIKNIEFDSKNIYSSIKFGASEMVLCTAEGLYVYNIKTNNQRLVLKDFCISVCEFNDKFYVGTKDRGIVVLNKSFKIVNNWHLGGKNNIIFSLLLSKDVLWAGTSFGLYQININTGKQEVYHTDDGIANEEFNSNTAIFLNNGYLAFAGINGITLINPKIENDIFHKKIYPYVSSITFRRINGNFINKSGWEVNNTFTLSPDVDWIRLEVGIQRFRHTPEIIYYRIAGLIDVFTPFRAGDGISINNLAPGTFQIDISATPNEGGAIRLLTLVVLPKWYQTLSFKIASVVFILFMVYFLVRYRIRIIRKKHKIESAAINAELKFLRTQINPHAFGNLLMIMQNSIMSKTRTETMELLSLYSKYMFLILENGQSPFSKIGDEIEFLTYYLKLIAYSLRPEFKFHIDLMDEQIRNLYIPGMLLQPLVENSIIHGIKPKEKGIIELEISFKREENRIIAMVRDTGVGLDEYGSEKLRGRKSFGLENITYRLRLVGETYNVKSIFKISNYSNGDNEKGVICELVLPIIEYDPSDN